MLSAMRVGIHFFDLVPRGHQVIALCSRRHMTAFDYWGVVATLIVVAPFICPPC
jgi:hypothetical protein